MKTFRIFIFFLLIINSFLTFSQSDTTHSPFTNIEIGSKKYYIIQMKDGSEHQARIISVDNKQTLLMNSGGGTFIVPTNEVIRVEEKAYSSFGSIGMGFGIPYGLMGFNMDIHLYKNLYLTGGIGTGVYVTPMYNIGGKLFLRSGNYKWRPRLSASYGRYGILAYEDNNFTTTTSESFSSFILGIGQQWTMGIRNTLGFDFDILYITGESKLEQRKQELNNTNGYLMETTGKFKVSIGLRYCF